MITFLLAVTCKSLRMCFKGILQHQCKIQTSYVIIFIPHHMVAYSAVLALLYFYLLLLFSFERNFII